MNFTRTSLTAWFWPLVGAALFALFFAVNLFAEFESSDDILLLYRASHQSIGKIFTSSYLTDAHIFFYRPLPTLITKALMTPSVSVLPYRTAQLSFAAITAACLLLYLSRERVSLPGLGTGLILLVASPFLRGAFTWWGDSTTLLSLAIFLVSLLLLREERALHQSAAHGAGHVHWAWALVLTALALLSKELGLIIGAMFAWHYARRREYVPLSGLALLLLGYFALRTYALGSPLPAEGKIGIHDMYGSAFILPYAGSDQVRAIFGNFPYPFYLYNVLAQISTIFFGQPVEGVLLWWSPRHVFLTVLQTFSSLLIFWTLARRKIRLPALFVLIIVLNAFISYRYTNVRHVPFSAVAWIILFALAVNAAWQSASAHWPLYPKAICSLLLIGWFSFACLIIADNLHYVLIQGDVYRGQQQYARLDLLKDQTIFETIRARHLK